jgi:hypothetical protein
MEVNILKLMYDQFYNGNFAYDTGTPFGRLPALSEKMQTIAAIEWR